MPSLEPDDTAAASCSEEEEDDEEQVERFYALLDNLCTMRGMLCGTGTSTTAVVGRRKCRAREAEPPPIQLRSLHQMDAAPNEMSSLAGVLLKCAALRGRHVIHVH
ncbi:hypothetical protein U9M48_027476 [Paspalum notatum var. saurae]|uniref:Uncharacterized protein n=1 Tax=Paspalum notatum var. saurae TaxID=547442 RepID=A0AAQ3TV84_PASNO